MARAGRAKTVNNGASATSGRNTVCNTLRSVKSGTTTLSTWAGTDFPPTCPPAPPART
ncbi:hypothetical protein [Streptomyces sp. KL116D]|uniref:hypothetical protein n=1 Tax=Streptomyces sp. KL116D TaxID=3045152 RepID=UPI003556D331